MICVFTPYVYTTVKFIVQRMHKPINMRRTILYVFTKRGVQDICVGARPVYDSMLLGLPCTVLRKTKENK